VVVDFDGAGGWVWCLFCRYGWSFVSFGVDLEGGILIGGWDIPLGWFRWCRCLFNDNSFFCSIVS
jgi:hypothetical protein